MSFPALQAHLDPAGKVLDDPPAFLFWDRSFCCCDYGKRRKCCLPAFPPFSKGFLISVIKTPNIFSCLICLTYFFSDLNLLDWSLNNYLAVALGSSVYLWNAASGEITQLMQLEHPEDYIGSVSWVKEGTFLAVGTSSGEVQV